jgi:hypothetical protein
MAVPAPGANFVWSEELNFHEFAGAPGGFEPGFAVLQSAGGVAAVRHYDVLRQTGTDAGGMAIFGSGQDGTADLTLRTRVVDGSAGRWTGVQAGKRPSGYNGGATIAGSTSRSGDWGLVALEFRFAPGMEISADQFALRLTSANGTTEAYEWSMVTLGGADDAPFSMADIGNYRASDYTALGSSTYYNGLGGLTGQPGTGERLATGRSMSQFLSGASAAPVSGGLVQRGWYAVDDFNAWVFDGPEAEWDNPYAEQGTLDDNPLITGTALGLAPGEHITGFTLWIGMHDVGFDSDGDGFTATDGNPFVSLAGLTLGCAEPEAVPEPSAAALALLVFGGLIRRKRN